MFKNLRKKTKKKSQLEKKVKNNFFSSCSSYFFALFILISPDLQLILKKKLHTWVDLNDAPQS